MAGKVTLEETNAMLRELARNAAIQRAVRRNHRMLRAAREDRIDHSPRRLFSLRYLRKIHFEGEKTC